MLHKLLIIVCLLGAMDSSAQGVSITPAKTTEKPADTQIDYKQAGAPMPPLRIINMDTGKNNSAVAPAGGNSATTDNTRRSRKKRRQEMEEQKDDQKQFITDKDLDNGANLFVMMFNPTCSHCMDETEMIEKNIGLFNKSRWVLLANPNMQKYVPEFIREMHVHDYKPFYIGIDSSGFLNNVYRYGALPQINVYSEDRKLIKIFNGEVPIDSLKEYIE